MSKWLALFGLPAEANPRELSRFPWVTVFLILWSSLLSILAFNDLELFEELAFYPGMKTRFMGLNLLTVFFVHGDWIHLLSNMYALFVFGDNVEDELGMVRYVLLVVGATLCGSVLSGWFGGGESIPHVGASGGIFGVMVFYLLRFPKARFTYFFLFRFYSVPAFLVLLFYLSVQLAGGFEQVSSVGGGVDYLAHLGGAAVGLLFTLLMRGKPSESHPS
ncbi:MAG: rhomboid family intramembrane serine protease [Bdellovibrionaceae bacterium]|nr:rhomboid family intramembrane serine protease [Bdellovibrionales bacterium]MCB9255260.1 rhomboid family intramembrane serine protease [Pseudobdellovibrionaceae bacterium]